jgi:hypothetical protein
MYALFPACLLQYESTNERVASSLWHVEIAFASVNNGLGTLFEIHDDIDTLHMQQVSRDCLPTILRKHEYVLTVILVFLRKPYHTLYIALVLSKRSTLVLLQPVFKRNSRVSLIANYTMALVTIWGLMGILTSSVGCSPEKAIPKPSEVYCIDSVSLYAFQNLDTPSSGFLTLTDLSNHDHLQDSLEPSIRSSTQRYPRTCTLTSLDPMAEGRYCRRQMLEARLICACTLSIRRMRRYGWMVALCTMITETSRNGR